MTDLTTPQVVSNWIQGKDRLAVSGRTLDKYAPATGRLLCRVARSDQSDVNDSVAAAKSVQSAWAAETVARRGEVLLSLIHI